MKTTSPLLLAIVTFFCFRSEAFSQVPTNNKTCLVLSVGALKGLAHIGAIDAIKSEGVRIDCVYGNSMGSVIGSLHVTAPQEELAPRYRTFIGKYVQATASEKIGSAALLGLAGLLLSGGTVGWQAFLGAGAGYATTHKLDNDRFRRVLDEYFGRMQIQAVSSLNTPPIEFATSYQMKRGQGLDLVVARTGNLAEAVARSANNPLIFEKAKLDYIDPGADRPSMTPIEETCRTFRPARIVAINVSGADSFYSAQMQCGFEEIKLDDGEVNDAAIYGLGPEFDRLYRLGYEATKQRLRTLPLDYFPTVTVTWHPDETVLRDLSGTSWVVQAGQKRQIVGSAAFDRIAVNSSNVVESTNTELDCYARGPDLQSRSLLLRGNGSATVYLLTPDGTKRAFSSADVFTGLGFKWEDVHVVPEWELAKYPNDPVEPTLSAPYPGGTLIRSTGSPTVFVLSNGNRRAITSARIFNALGYHWDQVIDVPESVLNAIPEASPIDGIQISRCRVP